MTILRWWCGCAGVAVAMVLVGQGMQPPGPAPSDQPAEPETPRKPPPGIPQRRPGEQTEAWKKAAEPNEKHRALDPMGGEWTATVTRWTEPGASAQESRGTMENRWVLGRRFLRGEFKGEREGQPYEGVSYFGYNTVKNRYEVSWMDTVSTQMMFAEGQFDPALKTFTLEGRYADPATGKEEKSRFAVKMESAERYVWEMYTTPPGGEEFKQVQIVFTKRP